MRTIILGDSHIAEPYLDELDEVFKEILQYDADECIHLGDFYNNNKSSPKELVFGTQIASALKKKYGKVTILSGNGRHEWLNDSSLITYLKELGIETPGMELKKTIDGKKCFFAHYMTNGSMLEYGSADITLSALSKYDLVLLGHQHIVQTLVEGKIYHLGSLFWQHWNESVDKYKQIAMIENGELKFIQLKTPKPMIDIKSEKELPNMCKNNKVRLIISSFDQFKRVVNRVKDWESEFKEFKTKLDFENKPEKQEKISTEKKKFTKDLIFKEIEKVEDKEARELLLEQFKEEKQCLTHGMEKL